MKKGLLTFGSRSLKADPDLRSRYKYENDNHRGG